MAGKLVGQTNLRTDSLKNKGIYVVNSNKIKQRRPLSPETHQTGFKSRKSRLIKPLCRLTTKTRCIVRFVSIARC